MAAAERALVERAEAEAEAEAAEVETEMMVAATTLGMAPHATETEAEAAAGTTPAEQHAAWVACRGEAYRRGAAWRGVTWRGRHERHDRWVMRAHGLGGSGICPFYWRDPPRQSGPSPPRRAINLFCDFVVILALSDWASLSNYY